MARYCVRKAFRDLVDVGERLERLSMRLPAKMRGPEVKARLRRLIRSVEDLADRARREFHPGFYFCARSRRELERRAADAAAVEDPDDEEDRAP